LQGEKGWVEFDLIELDTGGGKANWEQGGVGDDVPRGATTNYGYCIRGWY